MFAVSRFVPVACAVLAFAAPALAQPPKVGPTYTRTEDVIYGRRDGMALTMDVFTPTGKPALPAFRFLETVVFRRVGAAWRMERYHATRINRPAARP